MTGRNKNQPQKAAGQQGKRKATAQQVDQTRQRQPDQQTVVSGSSMQSQVSSMSTQTDDSAGTNVNQARASKDPAYKKINKAEIDESRTLKHVFKSNPDSQMKDFIKKGAKQTQITATKALPKTPADAHPPAVAQELLDTDDDVADNLGKLFKASKSYKNV